MKSIKNFKYLYPAINIILFQVIGIVLFSKDFSQRLKYLFIYMDVAVILSLLFSFITKVSKKKNKIIDLIFIPCIIFFVFFSIWSYRNASPFNVDPTPTIRIRTPDVNNPEIKIVSFETDVVNKSREPINVKFNFTKEDGAESWYPYYDIIPEVHVTEMYHLEPEKFEHIISEITVKTGDVRLITSHFTDVVLRYEIINPIRLDDKTLTISRWNYALDETEPNITKISYGVFLTNESEANIFIRTLKPEYKVEILNDIEYDNVITVSKEIRPKEVLEINWNIIIGKRGLTIKEIKEFLASIRLNSAFKVENVINQDFSITFFQ